jgi:hypothetical protein
MDRNLFLAKILVLAGGDTNLYGYVLNDPLNLIDPNGTLGHAIGGSIGDSGVRDWSDGFMSKSGISDIGPLQQIPPCKKHKKRKK